MTANHPEDLVARLTERASSANGDGRPAGGYWPDDAELDRQAATTITSLVGERDALRAEINQTREVCSVVRRQDYFDMPTPLLVEAQIAFAEWRALTDTAEAISERRRSVDDVLLRWRALASPHQEGTGT